MNLRSASSSLPKATAAAQVRSSRHAAAASFFAFLLMLGIGTVHAAQIRFGPYTNAIGATVVTNTDIIIRAVGDMGIDAAGNVSAAIGLPIKIHLGADGMFTNTCQHQNYFVTNAFSFPPYFAGGYLFRAPDDDGPTVYSTTAPGILIPGRNYNITLIVTNGSLASLTFNILTNVLGYTPLAPASTNGYQRALQVTNITTAAIPTNFWSPGASLWISNLIAFGTLNTNRYAAGTLLTSSTNSAGLVTFVATSQTNGYSPLTFTNVSQVLYTNALPSLTNGFVRSDITNNAATVQQLISATNGIASSLGISAATATNIAAFQATAATNAQTSIVYSNAALFTGTNLLFATSNSLAGQIGAAGISALTATNISTNQVFVGTNNIGISSGLSAFVSTNRFDVSGAGTTAATASTNAAGLSSGLSAYVSTNRFDVSGAATAATNALQANINKKANTNSPDIWNLSVHNAISVTGNDGSDTGTISANSVAMNNLSASASTNIILEDTLQMDFGIGGISDENGKVLITPEGVFYGTNSIFNGSFAVTNGNYINIWFASGAFLRSNTIAPLDWEFYNTNGVVKYGTNFVTRVTLNSGTWTIGGNLNANGINGNLLTASSVLASDAAKNITNIVNGVGALTNNGSGAFGYFGPIPDLATVTNIASGLSSSGINAGTATNISAFQIGQSNAFLFANKLDKTNGTSYGQVATNLATEGNLSFGFTGQATNIISTTNVVAFFNAGTSLATNGAFIWSSIGQYTNWITGAILTNNSTAWLMITNGVSLYSLAGASPFGTYSAVNGSGTPTAVPSFVFNHNGMVDVGFFSTTNFNVVSNSIVTNTISFVTNNAAGNFIFNMNGFGTNTRLYDNIMNWASTPEINKADNGAKMNWQALAAGLANTNTASGYGAAILSGATNKIQSVGASVIVGGMWNTMTSGSMNYCSILGGFSNIMSGGVEGSWIGGGVRNVNSSFYSWLGGGVSNSILQSIGPAINLGGYQNTNAGVGSVILGGATNWAGGRWSIAAGVNARASNDYTFQWSDSSYAPNTTNAQFQVNSTNGLYVSGPIWHGFNNTNGGTYFTSNTVSTAFSIYAVTNSMPNFSYWMGESNGILVTIYMSNGVGFMKNNWP